MERIGALEPAKLSSAVKNLCNSILNCDRFTRISFGRIKEPDERLVYAAVLNILRLEHIGISHLFMSPLSIRCKSLDCFPAYGAAQISAWENSRVIFLYRNPFDQAVSFYEQLFVKSHKAREEHAAYFGYCKNPSEMLRAITPTYLKFYLSHKETYFQHPDKVLFIPYERLKTSTKESLYRFLRFIGHTPYEAALNEAVNCSTINKIKDLEKKEGQTLGWDLSNPAESHMSEGKIGRYNECFETDDILWLQQTYAQYGINLEKEFILN
jgi:hypothetical protein